ncbi:MAG: hypothetical protein CMI54_00365 [Parcubacteria group bacterium]|nr:hypothetical protein [Parcubacteria group bacterium]
MSWKAGEIYPEDVIPDTLLYFYSMGKSWIDGELELKKTFEQGLWQEVPEEEYKARLDIRFDEFTQEAADRLLKEEKEPPTICMGTGVAHADHPKDVSCMEALGGDYSPRVVCEPQEECKHEWYPNRYPGAKCKYCNIEKPTTATETILKEREKNRKEEVIDMEEGKYTR